MSGFKETRDVSTCRKLSPPRSLQGEEDADVTWDLILKRYPNAAPLLCQMETVIERAEGLLHQLRSPSAHDSEKSSSFQIADYEDELMGPCHVEESTEVSMNSGHDSRLGSVENMTPEIASVISDDYQTVKSVGAGGSSEILNSPEVSSSSINESNSKILPQQELKIVENSTEGVGKPSSLEAWGKVVGENPTNTRYNPQPVESCENPPGFADAKEDSVSEHARRLNSVKIIPVKKIPKLISPGRKEEIVQRFAGTIATASKTVENTEGIREAVIFENFTPAAETAARNTNELGDRTRNSCGEIETIEKSGTPSESVKNSEDKPECNELVQGNGDEAVQAAPRSAVQILDEYSRICGIPVEYKNQSPSCSYNKNVVVKCCFGGFTFEACAQSKKIAKTDAAGKLLRCIAGRQIDGENMPDLKPFARKQIAEIISLGNGGDNETAVRKLFKICMELNAPEPVYTVHQDSGMVGNRYTVKCGALGITTSGYGIRVLVAKRVAADKLLHKYHENPHAGH